MAAYELDKLALPIESRFARPGDKHLPIGGRVPLQHRTGELVYADQEKVICRDFNYRDSELTKVSAQTRHLPIVVDGGEGVSGVEFRAALGHVVDRIIEFSGGEIHAAGLYERVKPRVLKDGLSGVVAGE